MCCIGNALIVAWRCRPKRRSQRRCARQSDYFQVLICHWPNEQHPWQNPNLGFGQECVLVGPFSRCKISSVRFQAFGPALASAALTMATLGTASNQDADKNSLWMSEVLPSFPLLPASVFPLMSYERGLPPSPSFARPTAAMALVQVRVGVVCACRCRLLLEWPQCAIGPGSQPVLAGGRLAMWFLG